jgi:hypothetical protein
MRFPLIAAGLLLASPASPMASPDPTRPQAEVPPARHLSALQSYHRAADPEPKPDAWRAANETVTRIGGWRTYAREPVPGNEAPTPAASASKAQGAHHHHHHGKAAK